MGFYIEGYYIGYETREFNNEDGSRTIRHSINVATGNLAYRIYMADNFDPSDVFGMKPGEVIRIACRIYVGKNGKLSVVDGEFVDY